MATLTIIRGDAERLKAVEKTFLTFATGLRFMAKRNLADSNAAAVIDKTVDAGIVITVPGDEDTFAEAQIEIDPEDTNALPNQKLTLFYALEDGEQHTLESGELVINPAVILDE